MNGYKKSLTEFLQGKNLLKVTSINLHGENLTAIPDIIFRCKNLRKLNLSNNQLTAIPRDITNLKKLKVLNLSYNKLTQIQSWVGKMQSLEILDISHNLIKSLPRQIQHITLEKLIASNNLFTTLDGLTMPSLKYLVLSHNKIEQLSPHTLSASLSHLWLNGNPCENIVQSIKENTPSITHIFPKTTINHQSEVKQINSCMKKHQIFISYAHGDKKWLDDITINLNTIKNTIGGIDVWDDTRITTGDKWKEEIEKALENAAAAILLVSPNFLASDFIINNELPPILKRASTNGTHIFPICVRRISNTAFLNSELKDFQFLNSPDKPLNSCEDPEFDEYMSKLLDDISKKLELAK